MLAGIDRQHTSSSSGNTRSSKQQCGRRTATAVAGTVGGGPVTLLSLGADVVASLLVPTKDEDQEQQTATTNTGANAGNGAVARPTPRVAWASPDASGPDATRDDDDTGEARAHDADDEGSASEEDTAGGSDTDARGSSSPTPTSPGLFHAGLGLARAAASYREEDRRRARARAHSDGDRTGRAGNHGGTGGGAPSSPPLEPLTPRHAACCTALRASFLGGDVRPETAARFIDALRVRRCRKGEYIIRQGDAGDSFYVVQEGHVPSEPTHPHSSTLPSSFAFLAIAD